MSLFDHLFDAQNKYEKECAILHEQREAQFRKFQNDLRRHPFYALGVLHAGGLLPQETPEQRIAVAIMFEEPAFQLGSTEMTRRIETALPR